MRHFVLTQVPEIGAKCNFIRFVISTFRYFSPGFHSTLLFFALIHSGFYKFTQMTCLFDGCRKAIRCRQAVKKANKSNNCISQRIQSNLPDVFHKTGFFLLFSHLFCFSQWHSWFVPFPTPLTCAIVSNAIAAIYFNLIRCSVAFVSFFMNSNSIRCRQCSKHDWYASKSNKLMRSDSVTFANNNFSPIDVIEYYWWFLLAA